MDKGSLIDSICRAYPPGCRDSGLSKTGDILRRNEANICYITARIPSMSKTTRKGKKT